MDGIGLNLEALHRAEAAKSVLPGFIICSFEVLMTFEKVARKTELKRLRCASRVASRKCATRP